MCLSCKNVAENSVHLSEPYQIKHEVGHNISYKIACAPSQHSDQPDSSLSLPVWRRFGPLVTKKLPCEDSDQTARVKLV